MPRKKGILPEDYTCPFPSRLREIMRDLGKTQQEVADAVGKTRQAVGYYAGGSSSPDWKTIVALAKYFDVSTDWLLGSSDVKTTHADIRQICEFTGLTEETVVHLNTLSQLGPFISSFVARFFEDILVFNGTSIELICEYIVKAAHAGAISNKNAASHIQAETDNIIDSMNGESNGQYRISATDAEGYFLISAQNIAKSSIDGILDTMMEELKGEYLTSNFVESTPAKNIWKLYGDDNGFFE